MHKNTILEKYLLDKIDTSHWQSVTACRVQTFNFTAS